MKKYRPIKLWFILLMLISGGISFGIFLMDGWKQILMLICTSTMFITFLLTTTYYIEFQNDKIVIKHGLSSFNRTYRSNLKTRYILFSDINDLSINYSNKHVIISLKNGNNILFSLNGYFKPFEIADKFKDIKNKLNYPR